MLASRMAALGQSDQWCCPVLPVSPLQAVALAESLALAARPTSQKGRMGGMSRGGRRGAGADRGKSEKAGAAALDANQDDTPRLIGSSLGGYLATWLAEKHGWRAVVLNPATDPADDLDQYLGEQPLWHGGGSIVVEPRHLDELRALRVPAITHPERYYLIAATGDEVLDYRDMLAHYPGAKTTLIEGGDHGISSFATYCDAVLEFCGVRANHA